MSNNKFKILVVEDEANIRSFVQTALEANSYQVLTAETCSQGTMMFLSHLPDLVILDLGLPDADGLEFLWSARKSSSAPIIVLSARSQEADKVAALDMGANDYITKPFGTAELMARVRAALRSSRQNMNALPGRKFVLHDLEIDYDKRQVSVGGAEVKFTQTEYNILALLSEHAGKMMTYSSIIRSIWGTADSGSTKKLQVNMANIRKKLGAKPGENRYITNELGVGYRMYEENE
ncbi:MAG: response regulator transcription factor [Butyricicoccus sp.]|nr:response regulator transcription factor [Butyricicoccus sp.]MBQ8584777.1 response regulator transcription factor [Butyricicoccus sp.]